MTKSKSNKWVTPPNTISYKQTATRGKVMTSGGFAFLVARAGGSLFRSSSTAATAEVPLSRREQRTAMLSNGSRLLMFRRFPANEKKVRHFFVPKISTSLKKKINQSVFCCCFFSNSYFWKHNKLNRILEEPVGSFIWFCCTLIPRERICLSCNGILKLNLLKFCVIKIWKVLQQHHPGDLICISIFPAEIIKTFVKRIWLVCKSFLFNFYLFFFFCCLIYFDLGRRHFPSV